MYVHQGILMPRFRRQLLATISVTILTFSHGIGLGWLAPMLLKLQSDESPLNFQITLEQSSWIGALVCAGGLLGNIVYASCLDRFGRKWTIITLVVPHMLLWVLVYFAKSVIFLYLARVFAGTTGGGLYVVVPIYISEISDSTVRGRLTSTFIICLNSGVLIGYIFSTHLSYHLIPLVVLPISIIFVILVSRFPETPQYLLKKGLIQEAEDSLKFYKNHKGLSKKEMEEFKGDFEDLKMAIEKQQSKTGKIEVRDFLNKKTMKIFLTALVLMVVNIYSATFAFMNYMSTIFAQLKTQIDPNTATIIVGVVQIVGTCVSTVSVDRFGRKVLIIASTAGMGIGLGALGLYAFFVEELSYDMGSYGYWLPLVLMSVIVFIGNCGLISVTIIVLVEIMPVKIRSMAASFNMAILSILAFILLKIYPVLIDTIGLAATFWCSACICTFAIFYVCCFLEETKGKSMYKDEDSTSESQAELPKP